MERPKINKINPNIKTISIYLRSTKKFGKSTLFRDVILEKYHDPSYGLLVSCGNEVGDRFLDNINRVHVNTWKELTELKQWLIKTKGVEHNIEIIAFDTVDELVLIADSETIRQSNIENPKKQVKSIKAAFGGYTAGEKYSANNLIKPYMTDLQNAGFGVWAIAHTKFKTIKEKGALDEDGYQQLTSNLSADYESAFGDIFDVTLTGIIDRNVEEIGEGDKKKRRATDTIRKLYFRETPVIDAGGRFAYGAVPEYMVFDKPNMAPEFLRVIEEGMEKSKLVNRDSSYNDFLDENGSIKTSKPPVKVEKVEKQVEEPVEVEDEEVEDDPLGLDEEEEETGPSAEEIIKEEIRAKLKKFSKDDKETRRALRDKVKNNGGSLDAINDIDVLNEILAILE